MKAFLSVLSLCFVLATGTAWAGLVGTTNPGDFQDTVDWCQFGCAGASYATPQAWVSTGGLTGLVGLNDPSNNFYNVQQGNGWTNDFPAGMGLIWNGAGYGDPGNAVSIVATFDQPNYGAGAYIDSDFFGDFQATINLYDVNYQLIGSYSANGVSGGPLGSALFIGMTDTTQEVWAAEFVAYNQFGFNEPDFAIGTLGIRTIPGGGGGGIPEPASFLLIGPALLAVGLLKKRLSH